jgi:rhizoxin synthesis polyketide synthase/nonribosomal peptide synthetase RhiB
VLACCRALARRCAGRSIDVFVCLDEAGEGSQAHDEALSGLLRSATTESPSHRYHWIRHAAHDPARGPDLAGEWLSACSRPPTGPTRPLVRFRDGRRFQTAYEEVQALQAAGTSRGLRPDGAYLVVGGSGAVGRRLCLEIGRKYRPMLVMVSRRAPEAEVEQELRATGARTLWLRADATDHAAMTQALAEIKRTLPRLDGVLHLARSVDDGLVADKTPEGFLRTVAAKVAGTEVVDLVTRDEPLEFFVMFSSMAAFGLPAASDYAYACAFQSAFARLRNRRRERGERSGHALSLCWGQWEVDRHVDAVRRDGLKDLGFDLIDAPSALRVLEACLNTTAGALGFVAVGDKQRARRALADRAAPRGDARARPVVPPPRPPAADARLVELRTVLEQLPYEHLLELHAAAVCAPPSRSAP